MKRRAAEYREQIHGYGIDRFCGLTRVLVLKILLKLGWVIARSAWMFCTQIVLRISWRHHLSFVSPCERLNSKLGITNTWSPVPSENHFNMLLFDYEAARLRSRRVDVSLGSQLNCASQFWLYGASADKDKILKAKCKNQRSVTGEV